MRHWYYSIPEKFRRKRDSNPGSSALEADAVTTRPTRQSGGGGGGDDDADDDGDDDDNDGDDDDDDNTTATMTITKTL